MSIAYSEAELGSSEINSRRHDLDALRAFAMLLGIGLHVSLSFFPLPWPVQDTQQSGLFALFMLAIHGFRMQLFFLLSGYFTMMVYRKRGMKSLLKQRMMRIGVPFILGVITIVPAFNMISWLAIVSHKGQTSQAFADTEQPFSPLWLATINNDQQRFRERILIDDVNERHPKLAIPLLNWCAYSGNIEQVQMLLKRGAFIDGVAGDGSTSLHAASFAGHSDIVELLLKRGANVQLRNSQGETALQAAQHEYSSVVAISSLLQLTPPEEIAWREGRERISDLLEPLSLPLEESANKREVTVRIGWREAYSTWLHSSNFQLSLWGRKLHLFDTDLFHHLWFLWFLLGMLGLFFIITAIQQYCSMSVFRNLPTSHWTRWLWIIPATMLPQYFMAFWVPMVGPDTSTGLFPQPHVFFYYFIFFWFGVMYFDDQDTQRRLGSRWFLSLPISLLVIFPLCLITLRMPLWSTIWQPLYAWTMIFSLIGLFRATMRRDRPVVRYVADAAYWLYLTHLPLVVLVQAMVRDWEVNSLLKFLFINVVVTSLLLISYHYMVRHTWIGVMLNGSRRKQETATKQSLGAITN